MQFFTSGVSKDQERHNTIGSLCQWAVRHAWWDYLSLKSFWRKIQQQHWALQVQVASNKVCAVWSFCGYVCRYVKWWIYSIMLPSTEVIAECWKLAKCPSIGYGLNNWCFLYSMKSYLAVRKHNENALQVCIGIFQTRLTLVDKRKEISLNLNSLCLKKPWKNTWDISWSLDLVWASG